MQPKTKTKEVEVTHKPGHAYGQAIFKKTISKIYVCKCGEKYLKTRPNQRVCIWCLYKRQA